MMTATPACFCIVDEPLPPREFLDGVNYVHVKMIDRVEGWYVIRESHLTQIKLFIKSSLKKTSGQMRE